MEKGKQLSYDPAPNTPPRQCQGNTSINTTIRKLFSLESRESVISGEAKKEKSLSKCLGEWWRDDFSISLEKKSKKREVKKPAAHLGVMGFVKDFSISIHDSIDRDGFSIVWIIKFQFFCVIWVQSAWKSWLVLVFMLGSSCTGAWRTQLKGVQKVQKEYLWSFNRCFGTHNSKSHGKLTLNAFKVLGSFFMWYDTPRDPTSALLKSHVEAAMFSLSRHLTHPLLVAMRTIDNKKCARCTCSLRFKNKIVVFLMI